MVDRPPLCIVQARMGSKRLPGKMMLPLAGQPLIYHAWRRSVEAFGESNVVVAIPASEENAPLKAFLERIDANVFEWDGLEGDVLSRFYYCANAYRWHPDTIILRVTPDDPLKRRDLMLKVMMGERHPVELSCEAITLEYLALLFANVEDLDAREHLSLVFSPVDPPAPPEGVWTIDTMEDYEAMKLKMEATV